MCVCVCARVCVNKSKVALLLLLKLTLPVNMFKHSVIRFLSFTMVQPTFR